MDKIYVSYQFIMAHFSFLVDIYFWLFSQIRQELEQDSLAETISGPEKITLQLRLSHTVHIYIFLPHAAHSKFSTFHFLYFSIRSDSIDDDILLSSIGRFRRLKFTFILRTLSHTQRLREVDEKVFKYQLNSYSFIYMFHSFTLRSLNLLSIYFMTKLSIFNTQQIIECRIHSTRRRCEQIIC